MRSVDLVSVAALFDGHVDCVTSAGRVQPVRYRIADAPWLDQQVKIVGAFAGGVRLRLRTDSRIVRLELEAVHAHVRDRDWWTRDFEVRIDDGAGRNVSAVGGAQVVLGGAISGDPRAVLTIDDLPADEKRIEIWFPPAAMVTVTGLQVEDGARLEPWPDTRRRIVFHGSSITQAVDANAGALTWPGVASAKANLRHLNLGWAGSCLISGLAARILCDEPADAIVLELGANVWEGGLLKDRTFLDSTHAMLAIIRERHVETPIAVVSPIAFRRGDEATNADGISLGRMRELLETVVAARATAGDENTHYLSGLLLSGEDDLDELPDGIHPNAEGNRRMGERFFDHMLAPGKPLAAR